MVGAQVLQALLQAGDQGIGPQVGDPDLGGQEQVLARHAAGGDGAAHIGLVLVDLRGVDGAVAQLQGGAHGLLHHIALQAESAQAQRDHGKGRQRGVPGYRSWEGFQNRGGAGGRTPPGEKGNGRCCRPHRNTAVARRCEAITKHGASVAQPSLQKKP
jgi:hypothetical protein